MFEVWTHENPHKQILWSSLLTIKVQSGSFLDTYYFSYVLTLQTSYEIISSI